MESDLHTLTINICVNSSPSVAYMRLNQCWMIVNWTLGDKRQWNFKQNTKFFIHENAFENIVCKMVAILSRGRWVNWDLYMIVAADWTDGVCGCIYCSWNSIVKLCVKKRAGSILVQVMTCWLMTPSHYLDQCWLIMIENTHLCIYLSSMIVSKLSTFFGRHLPHSSLRQKS